MIFGPLLLQIGAWLRSQTGWSLRRLRHSPLLSPAHAAAELRQHAPKAASRHASTHINVAVDALHVTPAFGHIQMINHAIAIFVPSFACAPTPSPTPDALTTISASQSASDLFSAPAATAAVEPPAPLAPAFRPFRLRARFQAGRAAMSLVDDRLLHRIDVMRVELSALHASMLRERMQEDVRPRAVLAASTAIQV